MEPILGQKSCPARPGGGEVLVGLLKFQAGGKSRGGLLQFLMFSKFEVADFGICT